MKNFKGKKSLLTILMVLALLVATASMTFASFNAFLVKANDGKYYEYNQEELNASYTAFQVKGASDPAAAMYNQFLTVTGTNGTVVALGDSVKGWMDYAAAQAANLKAQVDNVPFVINDFLALPAAPVYAGTVTNPIVVNPDGTLTPTVDLAAYTAARTQAQAAVAADYTTASYAALQTALTNNVVTDANTQAEINTATANINAAYNALVLIPKVTSVSAINATQVLVTFNKEMDKTTAEATADYLVNGSALTVGGAAGNVKSIVLSTDKKSVTYTFVDNKNNTSLTFVVQNVKTADQLSTIAKSTTVVGFADTVAPVVSKLEIVGTGNLEITFSEPLQAIANMPIVRVNGTPVTITAVTAGDVKVVVTAANLPTIAKGATATIYVAGAKDTAGNEMAVYNGSVVKPNDTTKPTIASTTQLGQNGVRFVFDKVLSATNDFVITDIKLLKGSTIYTSATAGATFTVTKNLTIDTTGKTYDVTFDLPTNGTSTTGTPLYGIYLPTSSTQATTLLMDAGAVADGFGNTIDAVSRAFTFTKDTTGPAFVSISVPANKETFEVTFDQDLNATTDATKVIVSNADGVLFPVNTAAVKGGAGNEKILVVDLYAAAIAMTDGTYTLQFQAGAVKDVVANNNAAFTTTSVVGNSGDVTKPVATKDGTSAANSFVVAFSEEVTSATALNSANYTLDGLALPTGTTLYFTDATKTKVQITLPANTVNIGVVGTGTGAILSVTNVADKAGNLTVATSLAMTIQDNTPAIVQSLQVSGDTIILTFNENIDNATAIAIDTAAELAANFEIKVGTDALSLGTTGTVATSLLPGSANKVVLTLTKGDGNWDRTQTITAKTVETTLTLKDANLLLVKAGVSVNN